MAFPKTLTLNSAHHNNHPTTIQYPYTHNNQLDFTDMLGWNEFLYFRMLNNANWWYIPALLSWLSMTRHMICGICIYCRRIFVWQRYDQPVLWLSGYIFFYKDRIPSGPTVAEILTDKSRNISPYRWYNRGNDCIKYFKGQENVTRGPG